MKVIQESRFICVAEDPSSDRKEGRKDVRVAGSGIVQKNVVGLKSICLSVSAPIGFVMMAGADLCHLQSTDKPQQQQQQPQSSLSANQSAKSDYG